ncbi:MAG TPA: hypothetical protein VEX36_11585 [Thermoleophilaceae bacterium]|nr:hypothetical protein [Thermoleophilaceae bacterium]
MRLPSKSNLLGLAVMGALALSASPALAQTEPLTHNATPRLSVKQEIHASPDFNCPLVGPSPPPIFSPMITDGGCRVHTVSPSVAITTHLAAGGVELAVSTCALEVDLRIDLAGEGYMSHQELTGPVATCTRKACGQVTPPTSEGRAWSMFMDEGEVAGEGPSERVVILFCHENRSDGSNTVHCEVSIPITHPTLHRYRFTATDLSGHGAAFPHCEITGTFDVEAVPGVSNEFQADQNIEIVHN